PYARAVSVQKCLRLTDLENVGLTPRHDTFFEMLGNFSFGPTERGAYFKEEAIAFAWEFVTGVLGLPQERLFASIFAGEGTLTPLPRPGIDTGMGIERLALIVQGKASIFETDLFEPLVDHILALSAVPASRRRAAVRDARIIADHLRALTFAIGEGALPGNEGAGYVLRRLLRRAVTRGRSGRPLGLDRPFLAESAALVV